MNILDRYGIKEVADVTFYTLDENGDPQTPVLYLDTLKVSTIEQTAENTSARGGKGNPELITWDYNKEINVTLEDALFSPKSLAIAWGGDEIENKKELMVTKTENFVVSVKKYDANEVGIDNTKFFVVDNFVDKTTGENIIDFTWTQPVARGESEGRVTISFEDNETQIEYLDGSWININGDKYGFDFWYEDSITPEKCGWSKDFVFDRNSNTKLNPTFYTENGKKLTLKSEDETKFDTFIDGERYFCKYELSTTGVKIDVNPNSFPGVYYVTGDTYARSETNGEDTFFQIIIPKAKILSENTLTMEAEGDPTVFNMNLKVLKPSNKPMMQLVQYSTVVGENKEEEKLFIQELQFSGSSYTLGRGQLKEESVYLVDCKGQADDGDINYEGEITPIPFNADSYGFPFGIEEGKLVLELSNSNLIYDEDGLIKFTSMVNYDEVIITIKEL